MRGELILLALLALPLALAANATTLTAGQSIVVDGTNYTLGTVYINHTHVLIDGRGILWEKEDCERTTYHWICLERISGNTSTFEIEEIDYNLTLTRTAPDELMVGDHYKIELVIENHGAEEYEFTVEEHTNLTIEDDTRFPGLRWTGKLAPGGKKELRYSGVADREGRYDLNATASGGGLNATDLHDIEVDDFITIEYDYTRNITQDTNYTFTLSVDTTQEDVELDTTIVLPQRVKAAKLQNLTQEGRTLSDHDDLNETLEYGYTYWATGAVDEEIILVLTTERNDTAVKRTYRLPLTTHSFVPLVIIHDHDGKQLVANTTHDLPIQVHNPNDRDVKARVRTQSILHTSDKTYTFAANNTTTLTFAVTPNSTTSTYNLRLSISYTDPNGDPIEHNQSIRIHGVAEPMTQEGAPQPTAELSGPRALEDNQTGTLTVTISDYTGEATLHLTKDGGLISEKTLEVEGVTTMTYTANGPGRYAITATLGERTVDRELTITGPAAPPADPTPQQASDKRSLVWIFMLVALIATGAGGAAYVIAHKHLRLLHLEEAVLQGERQLAEDAAFLSGFYPASNEDLLLQRALEEEVERLRQTLPGMRAERDELRRTTHKYPATGQGSEVRR